MENEFRALRLRAGENNDELKSMDRAQHVINIDRNRLAKIEEGKTTPYPEEVILMAAAYNAPELINIYCACYCPIGKDTVPLLEITEFDRIALRILGAMQNVEDLTSKLVTIAEDGKVDESEMEKFKTVMDILDHMAKGAQSLKLWAEKNISPGVKTK
jgi:transcriptional regulator with XRE-family HTH domain